MPAKKRAAEEPIDVDEAGPQGKAKGKGKVPAMFLKGKKPELDAKTKEAVDSLWGLMDDGNGWKAALADEASKPYFGALASFLALEKKMGKEIFPPEKDIFAAFNTTPLDKVRVVILGQDPYHNNGQAHGLCFSVQPGVKTPPSLVNMYKELATDIPGFSAPQHGYLMAWAKQGVLMLNATLTVEAHKANSHAESGWQTFTNAAIKTLSEKNEGLVFLLWGGFAQKKAKLIAKGKHHEVIQSAHPSPLSVKKWMGCKTFSKANDALKKMGKEPIDWTLPQSA